MSFLDNLENNLNALERQEQKDPEQVKRDRERREGGARSGAAAGSACAGAERIAVYFGVDDAMPCDWREQRVLVRFTWLDERLRLDAGTKRLELVPEPEGIVAMFSEDGAEVKREIVDLQSKNAEALARRWLSQ